MGLKEIPDIYNVLFSKLKFKADRVDYIEQRKALFKIHSQYWNQTKAGGESRSIILSDIYQLKRNEKIKVSLGSNAEQCFSSFSDGGLKNEKCLIIMAWYISKNNNIALSVFRIFDEYKDYSDKQIYELFDWEYPIEEVNDHIFDGQNEPSISSNNPMQSDVAKTIGKRAQEEIENVRIWTSANDAALNNKELGDYISKRKDSDLYKNFQDYDWELVMFHASEKSSQPYNSSLGLIEEMGVSENTIGRQSIGVFGRIYVGDIADPTSGYGLRFKKVQIKAEIDQRNNKGEFDTRKRKIEKEDWENARIEWGTRGQWPSVSIETIDDQKWLNGNYDIKNNTIFHLKSGQENIEISFELILSSDYDNLVGFKDHVRNDTNKSFFISKLLEKKLLPEPKPDGFSIHKYSYILQRSLKEETHIKAY